MDQSTVEGNYPSLQSQTDTIISAVNNIDLTADPLENNIKEQLNLLMSDVFQYASDVKNIRDTQFEGDSIMHYFLTQASTAIISDVSYITPRHQPVEPSLRKQRAGHLVSSVNTLTIVLSEYETSNWTKRLDQIKDGIGITMAAKVLLHSAHTNQEGNLATSQEIAAMDSAVFPKIAPIIEAIYHYQTYRRLPARDQINTVYLDKDDSKSSRNAIAWAYTNLLHIDLAEDQLDEFIAVVKNLEL